MRAFHPITLIDAMKLARYLEWEGSFLKPPRSTLPSKSNPSTSFPSSKPSPASSSASSFCPPPPLLPTTPLQRLLVKQLSSAEHAYCTKNNICYSCGDKWNHAHKCKSLSVIHILSNEGFYECQDDEHDPLLLLEERGHVPKISHFALMGISGDPVFLTILKVREKISNILITILLDSGSTPNIPLGGCDVVLGGM